MSPTWPARFLTVLLDVVNGPVADQHPLEFRNPGISAGGRPAEWNLVPARPGCERVFV